MLEYINILQIVDFDTVYGANEKEKKSRKFREYNCNTHLSDKGIYIQNIGKTPPNHKKNKKKSRERLTKDISLFTGEET